MEPVRLPTRERQRRDTRRLILDAALAEIAERGLAGARIGRIAAEAGVTRPTIYAHFPRKQDFLRELQVRTEARVLAVLRERLDAGDAGGESALVHRLADAIFDLVDAADPVLRREVFAFLVREPQGTEWVGDDLFVFLTERFEAARTGASEPHALPAVEFTRIVMTSLFGFLVVESAASDQRRRNAHRMLDRLCGERKR
jgi:AcrR family transcriptional regulator